MGNVETPPLLEPPPFSPHTHLTIIDCQPQTSTSSMSAFTLQHISNNNHFHPLPKRAIVPPHPVFSFRILALVDAQTVRYPRLRVESSKYKYERGLGTAVLPSASRKEAEERRRSPAWCRAIYSISRQQPPHAFKVRLHGLCCGKVEC